MNFEQLSDEWDKDCHIDEDHLDRSAIKTAQLHSKYLRILVNHKMKLSALETEYKVLRQKKFRFYRGEMTKQELQEEGWDQWQGVKPLKNEMAEFLEGDADLNKINVKCEYIKNMIEAIESILNQLKGRDWQIRSAIDWKKFVSGS